MFSYFIPLFGQSFSTSLHYRMWLGRNILFLLIDVAVVIKKKKKIIIQHPFFFYQRFSLSCVCLIMMPIFQ